MFALDIVGWINVILNWLPPLCMRDNCVVFPFAWHQKSVDNPTPPNKRNIEAEKW